MVGAQHEIMADDLQLHNHKQLFSELKKRFPEVPDSIVSILMRDNNFVRERCIDALGRESNKYLDDHHLDEEPETLHFKETDRQVSSSSGPGIDIYLDKRSDLADNHHGIVNVGSGANSARNHTQSNNSPGSLNTTPSSDVDVLAMYGPNSMYTRMEHQNGPFVRPFNNTLDSPAQPSGWTYPPPGSQIYPSAGLGHSQPSYPPRSQQSGAASLPQGQYPHGYPQQQQAWGAYDPRHATPPSTHRFPQQATGIRTPSPQHYALPYRYDYTQYNQPGSPNTGRTPYYPSVDLPSIPHTSPYNPSTLGYIPPATTATGTAHGTSSPSSVPPLWYPGSPTTPGSGGSNASTPTQPYTGGYTPIGGWRNPPGGVTKPEPIPGNMKLPVGVSGPPPDARRSSEDSGYTQALLLHQIARMEKIKHDLENDYLVLKQLEVEVKTMEDSALERKNQRSSTFPTGEDVGKMRDENRRLIIDIQLMTREIDVVNNGQTPLGVLDPEQNFYKNMASTGQRGSIHAQRGEGSGRPIDPPCTMGERVPPARPPPPTTSTPSAGGHVSSVVMTPTPSPPDPDDAPNWSCSACTFLNHPLMDRCECCEMPRINPDIQAYR